MLGLRSVPREDSSVSVAERMFGIPLNIPGSYLDVPEAGPVHLEEAFSRLQSGLPVWPPALPVSAKLVPSMKYAFLRVDSQKPSLSPLYSGPYEVVRQTRNTAMLRLGDRQEKVNISRLKPYQGAGVPEPVLPPQRGRPPKSN